MLLKQLVRTCKNLFGTEFVLFHDSPICSWHQQFDYVEKLLSNLKRSFKNAFGFVNVKEDFTKFRELVFKCKRTCLFVGKVLVRFSSTHKLRLLFV